MFVFTMIIEPNGGGNCIELPCMGGEDMPLSDAQRERVTRVLYLARLRRVDPVAAALYGLLIDDDGEQRWAGFGDAGSDVRDAYLGLLGALESEQGHVRFVWEDYAAALMGEETYGLAVNGRVIAVGAYGF